jgi:hypothetical protein
MTAANPGPVRERVSRPPERHRLAHRTIARALATIALASGAALVVHIVGGVSLRLMLALAILVAALAATSVWRRATARQRRWLRRRVLAGAASGGLAVVVYDITKTLLSQLDAWRYNAFETVRVFGLNIAGAHASLRTVYAAGTAYHVLNGVAFGIAFCLLWGERGVVAGMAWGLFLECFQLTLFPGWLDIRAIGEFAKISVLSHVAYGATLGVCCRYALVVRGRRRPPESIPE